MLEKRYIPTRLINKDEMPKIVIEDSIGNFRKFKGLFRILKLLIEFVIFKITGRLDNKRIANKIKHLCQQMGILWIKIGQLLSMRSDIFPSEVCDELAHLQQSAVGFPSRFAREIIENELNAKIEDIFSEFHEDPCAAASTAQVHKAFLKKEKKWVAIKVKRPGIDKIFSQDMKLIRSLFLFFKRFSIFTFMRWDDMIWEMEQVFSEELDYKYEISNQLRLKEKLALHKIYVPDIYEDYCTSHLMVMEFVEATSMVDYLRISKTDPARLDLWQKENNVSSNIVAKNLLHSYLRQVLEDNLFHADLHPGNIFLLKDSRIVLLDFGSVGSNENDLLRKYDTYLQALSTEQFSKAIDVFFLIMPKVKSNTYELLKAELIRNLHSWSNRCRVKELPYKSKSINTISDDMTRIMAKYDVPINWSIFKLLRGWTTMDTSLRELIPEADLTYLMNQYVKQRKKRELLKMMKVLPSSVFNMHNLIDIPSKLLESTIHNGTTMRRLSQVFEGTASRISNLFVKLFRFSSMALILLIAFFIINLLSQHVEVVDRFQNEDFKKIVDIMPYFDIQVWAIFVFLSIHLFLISVRLTRRFKKQD